MSPYSRSPSSCVSKMADDAAGATFASAASEGFLRDIYDNTHSTN